METLKDQSIEKVIGPYAPLDKSAYIRYGVLDLIDGREDTVTYLVEQQNLADDLLALEEASAAWRGGHRLIQVGESGTLYRMLRFTSWKLGLDKELMTRGTLRDRDITDEPSIVELSQGELLELDNGTSQWASAAVLNGDPERLADAPPKLRLTYDIIDEWQARPPGAAPPTIYDATIARQAATYLRLLVGEEPEFKPDQAEDYCFALAMDYVTNEEAAERWPELAGHESDRLQEMPKALEQIMTDEAIDSRDHRVIQAAAMAGRLAGKTVEFKYPTVVNKSWPLFWPFMAASETKMIDWIL